jgi:hypothetical protein
LILTISVLLAILGIASFPCWGHSARWGYLPSMVVGFLLATIAAITVGGRPLTDDERLARLATPTRGIPDVRLAQSDQVTDPGPP